MLHRQLFIISIINNYEKQFKKFIRMFTYEHIQEEPNWDNIDVIHAWGSPSYDGIYYNLCNLIY